MQTSLYSEPHFGQVKSSYDRRLFMATSCGLRVFKRVCDIADVPTCTMKDENARRRSSLQGPPPKGVRSQKFELAQTTVLSGQGRQRGLNVSCWLNFSRQRQRCPLNPKAAEGRRVSMLLTVPYVRGLFDGPPIWIASGRWRRWASCAAVCQWPQRWHCRLPARSRKSRTRPSRQAARSSERYAPRSRAPH